MIIIKLLLGLQSLIDMAVAHLTERGLKFNRSKTTCMTYGGNPFRTDPSWNINSEPFMVEDHVKYLGTILSNKGGHQHAESRVSSAKRAFYSLQAAELYKNCVSPTTAFHIYTTAVRSGLAYGCQSIYMSNTDISFLHKTQAKHLKSTIVAQHHY